MIQDKTGLTGLRLEKQIKIIEYLHDEHRKHNKGDYRLCIQRTLADM